MFKYNISQHEGCEVLKILSWTVSSNFETWRPINSVYGPASEAKGI